MNADRLELVGEGFSFPTCVSCDEAGHIYVAESGLPFGGVPPGGRVWQLARNGSRRLVAKGLRPPVNGLTFHQGNLYVSEGGHPGRISRLDLGGKQTVLLDHLPGPGNYHTNMVAFGLDGKLYFSQGAMTNTGIIGLDGSQLELVAWGLRNAYGLGFLPDGRLLALDQGPDDRGSRPVGNAPDLLFEVRTGAWYGWPDFIGGDPVTDPKYRPARGAAPSFVLANHGDLPPPERSLLRFPPHSAATKFAGASPITPDWAGQLFVALLGDEVPMTAPAGPRVGCGVVRIDPADWSLHWQKGTVR